MNTDRYDKEKKSVFQYEDGSQWEFIPKKLIKEKHPNGTYKIIGETTNKITKNKLGFIENKIGNRLYYQGNDSYKKFLYKVKGYIPASQEGEYIVYKTRNILGLLAMFLTILTVITLILLPFIMKDPMGLDPNVKDYDPKIELPDNADFDSTIVPGFQEFMLFEDMQEIYMALGNPKTNTCYFQYTVILDSTREELFSTELIPPGKAVTTVKLPRKLKSGIYPITVKIRAFDINDKNSELNGSEVKTKIVSYQRGD